MVTEGEETRELGEEVNQSGGYMKKLYVNPFFCKSINI